MAMLRVSDNLIKKEDEEIYIDDVKQGNEYKGIFYGKDSPKRYHEAGAHFSYNYMYSKLMELCRSLSPSRLDGKSWMQILDEEDYVKGKFSKIKNIFCYI